MGIGLVGPFISLIIDPEAEILHRIDSYLGAINVIIPHQQIIVFLSKNKSFIISNVIEFPVQAISGF